MNWSKSLLLYSYFFIFDQISLPFQSNRKQGKSCHKYNTSVKVIEQSKKVTKEYNLEHSK